MQPSGISSRLPRLVTEQIAEPPRCAGDGGPKLLGLIHTFGGGAGSFSASPSANPAGSRRSCRFARLRAWTYIRPSRIRSSLRSPRRWSRLAVAPAETGGAGVAAASAPGPDRRHRRRRRPPLTTPLPTAQLSRDGRTAIPPAAAPQPVKDAIYAANRIVGKPYRYGGGHRRFNDTGYDCSGTRQLRAARRRPAQAPAALERLHELGRGRPRPVDHRLHEPGHAYVVIAGLRFDTSGPGPARAALAQGRALEPRVHRAPPRRLLAPALSAGSSSRAARASARRRRPRRRPSARRAARARCRPRTGCRWRRCRPARASSGARGATTSAGTEKIRSPVSADCIVSPFRVSSKRDRVVGARLVRRDERGAARRRAVEDLAGHPLRRRELEVARREVVEQRVAGDVRERVLLVDVAARGGRSRTRPRPRSRPCRSRPAASPRRRSGTSALRNLAKNVGRRRRVEAGLRRVRAVVEPDADDLVGVGDRDVELHVGEREPFAVERRRRAGRARRCASSSRTLASRAARLERVPGVETRPSRRTPGAHAALGSVADDLHRAAG